MQNTRPITWGDYLKFSAPIFIALIVDSQIHAMSKSLLITALILLAFAVLEWLYKKISVKKS